MERGNTLNDVRPLPEYRGSRAHIFPSDHSLNWFVRQHRPELVKAGAILLLNGQWHAHDERMDAAVLEVGKRAAERRGGV